MVRADDVVGIYQRLGADGIQVWLTGGWGIDALLGQQTRPHKDLDVLVLVDDVVRLRELLGGDGYGLKELWSENRWVVDAQGAEIATAFVLQDAAGREIDVHAMRLDEQGHGLPAWADGEGLVFQRQDLAGEGLIAGLAVRCLSPAMQMLLHTGYELPAEQLGDLALLRQKFAVACPAEHSRRDEEEWEMKTLRQLPVCKHFRLQELADGVYAAIHIEGGTAIGNAGIVDLGGRTLVYDSLFTPQAGEDLRLAAEALFGRPVDAVINSHWHNDHIWGNQAFGADTDIVSSAETRRLIIATRGHGDFDQFMADAEANLEATRVAFQATADEGQRRQLALWVDYWQGVVAEKPILQVRAPNLTFVQRLAFHGTNRSAELLDFAGGHTESDAVLFLPQERIAFMSDLLFIGHQPYLGGGDPGRLLHILDEVSALAPKLLVPGHGPVGTADSLTQMGEYVHTLDRLARKMVQDGVAEATIDTMAVPEPYDDWLFAAFFPVNMHFLYQRHRREQGNLVA